MLKYKVSALLVICGLLALFPSSGSFARERGVAWVASAQSGFTVAYVYSTDTATANAYKSLLESNQLRTDLVPMGSVRTTDFLRYSLIIIGPETGDLSSWGDQATLLNIERSGKPILGLGEGGYAFFGKLHLAIGWGEGWHGSGTAIYVMDPNQSFYQVPSPISVPSDRILRLYTATKHIGIFVPTPSPYLILIGLEVEDKAHYPVIQQGRFLLWGFQASPSAMTAVGQQLFVNISRYMIGVQPIACPDLVPTILPSEIQQMIDALPLDSGTVQPIPLKAKTYEIEESIVICKNNVTLIGAGKDSQGNYLSVIKMADGAYPNALPWDPEPPPDELLKQGFIKPVIWIMPPGIGRIPKWIPEKGGSDCGDPKDSKGNVVTPKDGRIIEPHFTLTGIRIAGLKIDGNRRAHQDTKKQEPDYKKRRDVTQFNAGVVISNNCWDTVNDVTIEDVHTDNTAGDGIFVTPFGATAFLPSQLHGDPYTKEQTHQLAPSNIKIINNTLKDPHSSVRREATQPELGGDPRFWTGGRQGIAINGGRNIQIENNKIINVITEQTAGEEGRTGLNGGLVLETVGYSYEMIDDVKIIGNTIIDTNLTVVQHDRVEITGVVVDNNTIKCQGNPRQGASIRIYVHNELSFGIDIKDNNKVLPWNGLGPQENPFNCSTPDVELLKSDFRINIQRPNSNPQAQSSQQGFQTIHAFICGPFCPDVDGRPVIYIDTDQRTSIEIKGLDLNIQSFTHYDPVRGYQTRQTEKCTEDPKVLKEFKPGRAICPQGIFIAGPVTGSIENSKIVGHPNSGIVIAGPAQVSIDNNTITDNGDWGVAEYIKDCFLDRSDAPQKFGGKVEGKGNTILGNGTKLSEEQKLYGDGVGNVCPRELAFLIKSPPDPLSLDDPDHSGDTNPESRLPGIADARTLQDLINTAESGAALSLPPGIYQGTLVIERKEDLVLDGASRVLLIGNGTDPVIHIKNSRNLTLQGLTIRRGWYGLKIEGSSNITLSQSTIAHNRGPGIRLNSATGVQITRNAIHDNEGWGIAISAGVSGISRVTIANNRLMRNRNVGIIVFGRHRAEVTITGNEVIEARPNAKTGAWGRGIEIQETKATITNNVIRGHPDVGLIAFSSEVEIIGNEITEMRGKMGRGVELQDSRAVLIRNSIIDNEEIGLALFASAVRLEENVIRDNGLDFFADGSSTVEDSDFK